MFKKLSRQYSTEIDKITATVLKYFAIFKNVAHSLEPGETPSSSH